MMNTFSPITPAQPQVAFGAKKGRKLATLLAAPLAVLALTGCSAASQAKLGGYGDDHQITLYSGGEKVDCWISNGKVEAESNSDGYYFEEKSTGRLIETSGDVVIEKLSNGATQAEKDACDAIGKK